MKIKTITKEDAELMPFDDIAYAILKEKGKKIKIQDLFKVICDLLELSQSEYEERIADFFTLLSTEKRFIQLKNGYWDLRENHCATIIKDEEEDTIEEIKEDDIEEGVSEEEDIYSETIDTEDEEVEDDLKDLALIDEDEIEETNL